MENIYGIDNYGNNFMDIYGNSISCFIGLFLTHIHSIFHSTAGLHKIKGLGTGECGKLSLVKIKLIALCIMRCWFFMKIL